MKKYLSEALFLMGGWITATTGVSFIMLVMLRYFENAVIASGFSTKSTLIWYMTSDYQLFEGLIFGFCFGLVHFAVHWFTERANIQKLPFGRVILFKSLLYLAGLLLASAIVSTVVSAMPHFPDGAMDDLLSQELPLSVIVASLMFILFFLVLFNFLLEINKKFGPKNLMRIFSGRYHSPVVEERLFMFIDLRSSTYYAERLGHFKYSQLIQLCFRHLNKVLDKHDGEIYQYVGDEAVITWDARKQSSFGNCIDFFFAYKAEIASNRATYESLFGLVPEFKAGVNCGSVTVAEVGTIKREIAYHGDVINTAARIQEQCNRLGHRLLVSGEFLSEMDTNHGYYTIELGATELKGKYQPVAIYAIDDEIIQTVAT